MPAYEVDMFITKAYTDTTTVDAASVEEAEEIVRREYYDNDRDVQSLAIDNIREVGYL